MEQVHLDARRDRPRKSDDLPCGRRRAVAVAREDRPLRAQEPCGSRPFGHERGSDRPLAEQVVEGLSTTVGDESLRDYDAGLPRTNERFAAHQGIVAWMGLRDLHVIRRIRSTNFPQPCQRGSAVGNRYFVSYDWTVSSTSSRVMFSWLMPMPRTLPFPAMRAKNSSHSISSPTVGMGQAATSRRKLRVARAGACIMNMPLGIDALIIARVPHTYACRPATMLKPPSIASRRMGLYSCGMYPPNVATPTIRVCAARRTVASFRLATIGMPFAFPSSTSPASRPAFVWSITPTIS